MTQFDYKRMKQVCLSRITDFKAYGNVYDTPDGIMIYKDNKSPVLAVAHLDTVLNLKHFHTCRINNDDIIINAQLDDRLGAYVLLDVLPSMGIQYDLLLTEGEETCRSTATYFETDKHYNWAFSFDRRGEGVVLYQYHGKQWEQALKAANFKIEQGTYSDIASLELGVKAVNVGTGYHGEHNDLCYASMNELKRQVMKFERFYKHNKDTRFDHAYESPRFPYPTYSSNYPVYYGRESYNSYDNLMCYLCNGRTGIHQIVNDIWLCNKCFNDAEMCQECEDIFYSHDIEDGLCPNCRQ